MYRSSNIEKTEVILNRIYSKSFISMVPCSSILIYIYSSIFTNYLSMYNSLQFKLNIIIYI